jgi:hypothetical protein
MGSFAMSGIKVLTAALAIAATAMIATPASAQWHGHHGWGHHGYRHHGGGFYFGFGAPYAYAPRPYYYGGPAYYGPACRWERVRFWRHGRWHWRSVRRCY